MAKEVKVTYYLSTEGQKLSILSGGDGKLKQELSTPVTDELVSFAEVDRDGNLTIDAGAFHEPEWVTDEPEWFMLNVSLYRVNGVKWSSGKRTFFFDKPQTVEGILAKLRSVQEKFVKMGQSIDEENERRLVEFEQRKEKYLEKRAVEKANADTIAAEKAAQEQQKAAREAERKDWILAHGSQYLKDCLELNVRANLEYVVERAGVEYPDYTVDYTDNAKWEDRFSPTPEALAELKQLRAKGVESEIAWLTRPAKVRDDEDEYDEDNQFEACEAVVIRNFLGKYDLIKII